MTLAPAWTLLARNLGSRLSPASTAIASAGKAGTWAFGANVAFGAPKKARKSDIRADRHPSTNDLHNKTSYKTAAAKAAFK